MFKSTPTFKFRSRVWVYPGMAAWRFLSIPRKAGQEIRKKYGAHARGWGSLTVSVTIGKTSWQTSIFPDKKSGSYLLPLKAKIRKAEKIGDNSLVRFQVAIP